MPTLKANHRQILAAKPIGGKKTRYRVEGVPGLWLYVSPTGVRTWYARYQIGVGKARQERWYRIGDAGAVGLATAIKKSKGVVAEVAVAEKDPHAERVLRSAESMTVGDLYASWYARHALPTLARAETDETTFRCHIDKEFGRKRLKQLTRVEIGQFRDAVAKKTTPLTSNRVMVLLNRILNWGLDEGLIEYNPAARLRKVGERRPRERVLAHDNILKFWQSLDAMDTLSGDPRAPKGRTLSPATRIVLRVLLLTGQRRTEVVEAKKSEFELAGEEPVWTIPGERTKNGLLHRLPLCPMAAAEFRKAIAVSSADSLYVFPSSEDPKRPISAAGITRAMARLIVQLQMPTVSPHDLRRTVGTELARLGLPVHVRSLVLNHAPMSRGITDAVYNRYAYDREKREALEAWEGLLTHMLTGEPVRTISRAA
ncbi:MAG: tyrosine-type recombinase/integrase [Hyphomicrobium sp.]|jgi:integrase|uniref:tyrosine-type recombinase/integrase n=1 Tax=Hyphomicrobium sp. TaxID=82 RepID=UPI0025BC38B9|nr:site-specific integrase [Hyphomicrobium sp.]MBX9864507.1 tyrosine-type recombinase/integrase [Hyphomicrobium sp.]